MRFFQIIALAAIAPAIPVEVVERQVDRPSITENEFSLSVRCVDVVFVWARGSTEAGNMPLGDELRRAYGSNLQIKGVDYAALLSTNYLSGGTDLAAELEMRGILNDIHSRCPASVIVTGGYSQGAAVNHRAIEDLSADMKNQIAGVVTFGDTQARADGRRIPNFPQDKIRIFCGEGRIRDTVCDSNLIAAVLAPHLSYGADAGAAGSFLIGKINCGEEESVIALSFLVKTLPLVINL
ncbi:cutinase-domain-containing protein [Bimuria novae-zelandiae CBS 107.79]|uniref:Cutinase n=1 Tax=Bimuria novae-zelandiae CBS 107.79 TaxID=1447943 RepID=A0A6A5VE93_9PLEO|nr:cutinase-domain-containing protein [Bimuria novae-zelandiae CBS 107.79]